MSKNDFTPSAALHWNIRIWIYYFKPLLRLLLTHSSIIPPHVQAIVPQHLRVLVDVIQRQLNTRHHASAGLGVLNTASIRKEAGDINVSSVPVAWMIQRTETKRSGVQDDCRWCHFAGKGAIFVYVNGVAGNEKMFLHRALGASSHFPCRMPLLPLFKLSPWWKIDLTLFSFSFFIYEYHCSWNEFLNILHKLFPATCFEIVAPIYLKNAKVTGLRWIFCVNLFSLCNICPRLRRMRFQKNNLKFWYSNDTFLRNTFPLFIEHCLNTLFQYFQLFAIIFRRREFIFEERVLPDKAFTYSPPLMLTPNWIRFSMSWASQCQLYFRSFCASGGNFEISRYVEFWKRFLVLVSASVKLTKRTSGSEYFVQLILKLKSREWKFYEMLIIIFSMSEVDLSILCNFTINPMIIIWRSKNAMMFTSSMFVFI